MSLKGVLKDTIKSLEILAEIPLKPISKLKPVSPKRALIEPPKKEGNTKHTVIPKNKSKELPKVPEKCKLKVHPDTPSDSNPVPTFKKGDRIIILYPPEASQPQYRCGTVTIVDKDFVYFILDSLQKFRLKKTSKCFVGIGKKIETNAPEMGRSVTYFMSWIYRPKVKKLWVNAPKKVLNVESSALIEAAVLSLIEGGAGSGRRRIRRELKKRELQQVSQEDPLERAAADERENEHKKIEEDEAVYDLPHHIQKNTEPTNTEPTRPTHFLK